MLLLPISRVTLLQLLISYDLISTFYHRLSHTFGNIIDNHLKYAMSKVIWLAVISKFTSKNPSQELSLGIAQYNPGHLSQQRLTEINQVLISWLYITEHLTFIRRLVTEISFRNNLKSVLFDNLIKPFSSITRNFLRSEF